MRTCEPIKRWMAVVVVAVVLLGPARARAADDVRAAALLTELVTAALANHQRFDVMTTGDLRRELELEGARQATGCSSDASCIAELAGALGAPLVVYGSLGRLDDVVVLTLNIFDSRVGRAAGRVVVKAASLNALSDQLDQAAKDLAKPYSTGPTNEKLKLLVLQIESGESGAAAPPSPSPPSSSSSSSSSSSPTFMAGLGALAGGLVVGGLGLGAFVVGLAADQSADAGTLNPIQTQAKYDERDAWGAVGVTGIALGAAGLALGVGLLTYSIGAE